MLSWGGGPFVQGLLVGSIFWVLTATLLQVPVARWRRVPDSRHDDRRRPQQLRSHALPAGGGDGVDAQRAAAAGIRVFCIVLGEDLTAAERAALEDTWPKHCDGAELYDAVPHGTPGDDWALMRKVLASVYDAHGARGYGWYLLAPPTTFVVVENLKFLVCARNASAPLYLGRAVASGDLRYVTARAGVLLSAEALRRLRARLRRHDDDAGEGEGDECGDGGPQVPFEQRLAACLRRAGVRAENAEDGQGRDVFHAKPIARLIQDALRAHGPRQVVRGCCSDVAVTFHGLTLRKMEVMMYGVYRLRAFGRRFNDTLLFLPPKGSEND